MVSSEFNAAKELYNDIVKDDFKTLSIFVVAVDATVDTGYWGGAKNELWDWLKDNGVTCR